jgi:tetratricopeptide (TPR) repeat protein
MSLKMTAKICVLLFALGVCCRPAQTQTPAARPRPETAPVSSITIDGRETMFATMCALYASGYEGNVSADDWTTFRTQMRDRARQQQGPAVEAVREFYRQHQLGDSAALLSRYVWFGLVAGPPPGFQPVMRREELPPEVLALEGFSELLSAYYSEQKIAQLWRQVQPVYNREIERLHDPVSQVILVVTSYLREVLNATSERSFAIIVEPLVGRITNVRNYGDHYAIILSGSEEIPIDLMRHAFLHFLLDPLPLTYAHVVAVKRPLFEMAARAPRLAPDLSDDFFAWFSECTVRAADLRIKRMTAAERDTATNANDADGYVLVRPLANGLTIFEKSEPSMKAYFPELVRGIDLKAEEQRIAGIQFARAGTSSQPADIGSEQVTRRHNTGVTTVPNDQDAIAELMEGERRIAERNPRAAEASFQRVLEKYPEQTRAWYGLGLVALLDHNAERATEIFGRLTTGEHAATQDPMVMAWAHVYLGRIYEDAGQLEGAKKQYQAALAVQGAPAQAQQAAQKGLGDLDVRKPSERP